MGNNLSPLDIHSHALFLLGFALWKRQTLFSVSKQMRKVSRLEKARVKPNKRKAMTSNASFPCDGGDTNTSCGKPSPTFVLKGCTDNL